MHSHNLFSVIANDISNILRMDTNEVTQKARPTFEVVLAPLITQLYIPKPDKIRKQMQC